MSGWQRPAGLTMGGSSPANLTLLFLWGLVGLGPGEACFVPSLLPDTLQMRLPWLPWGPRALSVCSPRPCSFQEAPAQHGPFWVFSTWNFGHGGAQGACCVIS